MPKERSPNVRKSPRPPPYRASESSQRLAVPSSASPSSQSGAPPLSPPAPMTSLPLFKDFLDFAVERVLDTIQRNDLDASSEDIFRYVIGWTEKDESRYPHLLALLLEVRLIFLPYQFLSDVIASHPLVKASEACRIEVDAAMAYHYLFPEARAFIRSQTSIDAEVWPCAAAEVFKQRFCVRRRPAGPAKLIYVIGSEKKTENDPNPCTMKSMEFYATRTGERMRVRDIPYARERFGAAAYGEEIWIAGGRIAEGEQVSSVYVYNPATSQWRQGPRMSLKRSDLGLVEYDGQLHAIGGVTSRPGRRDMEPKVFYEMSTEVLDSPINRTWRKGPPMNVGRAGMGLAVLRHIYVIGGEQYLALKDRMEFFSSASRVWVKLEAVDMPEMIHFRRLVVYDGLIYVFGGHAAQSQACYAYNSLVGETGRWEDVENINVRCMNPAAAIAQVDGHVYFIGGSRNRKRIKIVSKFDIENGTWHRSWMSCCSVRANTSLVVMNDHRPTKPEIRSLLDQDECN